MRRALLVLSCSVALFACGGGGGSSGSAPADGASDSDSAGGTASANTAGRCTNVRYAAAPTAAGGVPAGARLLLTDATTKIRRQQALDAVPEAPALSAARNEYEMWQVVVRDDGAAMRIDDIALELPTLPTGVLSDVERVMIYRADYMNIVQVSNADGATGEWPDALVPKVDAYACETRNAFPAAIPAGRNQSFYVEAYVPLGTPAGRYDGSIAISGSGSAGAFTARLPVSLTVRDFTLPSTATLKSNFGFIGRYLPDGHQATFDQTQLRRLTNDYALAGLKHRTTISNGLSDLAPSRYENGAVQIDWRAYDEDVTPFIEGSAHHNGARWSAVNARPFRPQIFNTDGAAGLTAFYKAWTDHFAQKNWTLPLWAYTADEPKTTAAYDEAKARARAMLAADPKLKPLVTANLAAGMRDTPETSPIRLWVPLLNHIDADARRAFEPYIAAGAELWWYQSCESFGCTGYEASGYPSYAIDAPGSYARAMEWLSFVYDMNGELYYNTMEAYFRVSDPWVQQYIFGGNGDGNLFYPGRPTRIGGSTHVPVESLRLKLIREGYEDYEYLRLAAQRPEDAAFAREQAQRIARAPRDFAHDSASYYAVRDALGAAIEANVRSGRTKDAVDGR